MRSECIIMDIRDNTSGSFSNFLKCLIKVENISSILKKELNLIQSFNNLLNMWFAIHYGFNK